MYNLSWVTNCILKSSTNHVKTRRQQILHLENGFDQYFSVAIHKVWIHLTVLAFILEVDIKCKVKYTLIYSTLIYSILIYSSYILFLYTLFFERVLINQQMNA